MGGESSDWVVPFGLVWNRLNPVAGLPNGSLRRNLLIGAGCGEGSLTEPIGATQLWEREVLLMPRTVMHKGHLERGPSRVSAGHLFWWRMSPGYSPLMGADEEGTFATLKTLLRAPIEPKIKEHRG